MKSNLRKWIGAAVCAFAPALLPAGAQTLPNPIVFVTQTPDPQGTPDFGNVAATFGNHLPDLIAAPRGGSLYIRYPDGTLRDLLADALAEACASGRPTCDTNGVFKQGGGGDPLLLVNGYAVREPTVHWDGNKLIFSLLKNVAKVKDEALPANTLWQIYEIAGLGKTDQPVLTKVANQPAYNNVAPIYGSDDKIFFASDRPITGKPYHKERDHYESQPSTPGLWKLDPATGSLALMVHASSGVFSLFLDSFGQVVFMQWDHMQQDQQALNTLAKTLGMQSDDYWEAYTYANEDDNSPSLRKSLAQFIAEKIALNTPEGDLQAYGMEERHVPEYHESHPILAGTKNIALGMRPGDIATTYQGRQLRYLTPANKYGRYDGLNFNKFFTWQLNQDGTGHETFRHTGLDDLAHFANRTYMDDNALSDLSKDGDQTPLNRRFGHFNVVEAPVSAAIPRGTYVGIASQEFSTHTTGFILQMKDNGQTIGENAKNVSFVKLTNPNSNTLYRNPIFLADGTLVATVDEVPENLKGGIQNNVLKNKYRLYKLRKVGSFYEPDVPLLPTTIDRNFTYWDPGAKLAFNGAMWQLNPVEVRPRARPPLASFPGIPAPEMSVFAEKGVDPQAFRQFMIDRDLALIVSHNVTKRDKEDVRQPFNLRVDPANVPAGKTGAKTIKPGQENKPLYDVAKLQIYQADLVRGYATKDADTRRSLMRPMHFPAAVNNNPPVAGAVPGSVSIAYDGSFAAFVPANRSTSWTLSDKDGDIVVRERYQLKFAPGEVRVCASCHGVNDVAQDGLPASANAPEALRQLLDYWKQTNAPAPARRADLNGDGRSEIIWHHATAGVLYGMNVNGTAVAGGAVLDVQADANWKVAGVGDLNGDGKADIVWRNGATGEVYGLLMNGNAVLSEGPIYAEPNLAWKVEQVADLDGDGKADLVWKNGATGEVYVMKMNGLAASSGQVVYAEPNLNWKIVASGDMNGDGKADLLWRNQVTGDVFAMLMNGFTVLSGGVIYSEPNTAWKIVGLADFNGDGKADVLWQNTATGDVFQMQMNGTLVSAGQVFYNEPNTQWKIAALGDYNGDGKGDVLWRNAATGQVFMMLMNGFATLGSGFVYTEPDLQWTIAGP